MSDEDWKFRVESVYALLVHCLVAIGIFAAGMFVLGYMWVTYVPPKTCTPDLIDRVLK